MKPPFFDLSFSDRVREVVRGIPKGSVRTYGEVASLAGSKGAARAVGNIMKGNYDPTVPCHRVVASNGQVADYNRGGKNAKLALLKKEGVSFTKQNTILFTR